MNYDPIAPLTLIDLSTSSPHLATSDQIRHWKQKAKDRKTKIVHLREEIKLLQDGFGCDLDPPIASCRCHFFEAFAELTPHLIDATTGDERWIDNVLRRRFIRLVRWKERRRRVERPIERTNLIGKH
ncbi:protein MULTIPOLAR SPINDLE 1-like [Carex rostrata]